MQLFALLAAGIALQAPAKLESVDLKAGKGAAAVAGDTVTVDYVGTLKSSGKQFDSSKNKPTFTFTLGKGDVIKGWDQGVAGMKTGGKRRLVIPPSLAYGEQDLGDIPPHSTLVFEIELLHVAKKGVKPMIEIEEIAAGSGVEAKAGDTVEVHYTGRFLNGTKFDSSKDRNQPFTVQLGAGRVIKGFDQGLTGMKVGGKRKVKIPADLAYGERGAGGVIPPNTPLEFELELIAIK